MAAVFVLPTPPHGKFGPVASYLSTAGWADAGEHLLGRSWIVCPAGVIDPIRARSLGADPVIHEWTGGRYPHVPAVLRTLAKDLRRWYRARQFVIGDGPWDHETIDFVWQRHDLFHHAGLDLAQSLDVPSVLFVPATTVWEDRRWGTVRPGWGRLVERWGERPALRRADVVACGSAEVAKQVRRMGTPEERILITPTGVDLELFRPDEQERAHQRKRLGLGGRFVVGWVGSFRPFHALEQAIEAVVGLPDATLLLVGDGPERPAIEALARARGVATVATGTVTHAELPALMGAMDVGLVLSRRSDEFHYSPLKLAEYLASGLAVIAPDVPHLRASLVDGDNAMLVPAGETAALRTALLRLHDEPELRSRLGEAARSVAEERWSWDVQVSRIMDALGATPHHPMPGRRRPASGSADLGGPDH